MELPAVCVKEEPSAEERVLKSTAIKEELHQVEVCSIKEELPELKEAGPEGFPEVSCVDFKEEALDLEPAHFHRMSPDPGLLHTTECGHTALDRGRMDLEIDPCCIPHSFFFSDPEPPNKWGCDTVLGGEGPSMPSGVPPQCPHSQGTPKHFTIHADGFTPHMKFPCSGHLDLDSKPYLCGSCSKAFRRLDHLRRHQSMHSGEKPFHCVSCEKRFSLRRSQEAHQRHCKGLRGCSCSVCGDIFQSFSNLRRHQRIHDGEKSYQCSRCGQNDKQSHYYRKHQRVHCGDQPYLCLLCAKKPGHCEKH